MKPEGMLASISSREDFMRFLEALIADHADSTDGWENTSLERFLEAMHAWAVDTQSLPEQPDWRFVVQLLVAGKIYE